MKKEKVALELIIGECNKHLSRLDYAYNKILPLLPFTMENVGNLSEEDIGHLDQYIFRFSKLQDVIGQKLFKGVLQFLGEEIYNKPLVDVFNRLEQLGIVEDYDGWNELRTIRNEVTHEYDEHKQELAEKLNKIINSKTRLEKYRDDVLNYLKSRGWNVGEKKLS